MKYKLILCLLLVTMLFGCTADRTAQPSSVETTASTTVTTTVTTTQKAAKTTATTTQKATTTAKQTTTTKKTSTTQKPTTTKRANTTKKPTATKKPTETSTTRADNTHCTVTIQCREVLGNIDKLKEGYEAVIPQSGYFLRNAKVKYEDSDTVYTVLQRACRENGIKMGAKPTGYGMYVYSINYLPEKACGGTSGWTYYVNGTFPHVSVDNYPLHGGETIEFKYVC